MLAAASAARTVLVGRRCGRRDHRAGHEAGEMKEPDDNAEFR